MQMTFALLLITFALAACARNQPSGADLAAAAGILTCGEERCP